MPIEKLIMELAIREEKSYVPLEEAKKQDVGDYMKALQALQKEKPFLEGAAGGQREILYEFNLENAHFDIERKLSKVILCDCLEGDLDWVAETSISWPDKSKMGDVTQYHQCNGCKSIFQVQKQYASGQLGDIQAHTPVVRVSDYTRYTGRLTRKELVEQASHFGGKISEADEAKVIGQRRNLR